ncbi:MAG: ubiquitin-like protein Pup [Actinomycetota bacterium]|nr:ubiquitin-like protein Pup [Actinomycetota bacterium]
MASKDTGPQQRGTRRSDEVDAEAAEASTSTESTERKEQLDEDIDAILDEIDEALESNAEEFVRGFVQKGGQ